MWQRKEIRVGPPTLKIKLLRSVFVLLPRSVLFTLLSLTSCHGWPAPTVCLDNFKMDLSLSMSAMAIRRFLSLFLLILTAQVALSSASENYYDEDTNVIFPIFNDKEPFFLEDTIIVTYENANRPGPMVVMCSVEHTGHGMSPTEWKNGESPFPLPIYLPFYLELRWLISAS